MYTDPSLLVCGTDICLSAVRTFAMKRTVKPRVGFRPTNKTI